MIISAAILNESARESPPVQKRSRTSLVSISLPRTSMAASRRGWSARRERKRIASKTFDFPTPFGPAIHVNGPKSTEKAIRFLNPFTSSLVSNYGLLRQEAARYGRRLLALAGVH